MPIEIYVSFHTAERAGRLSYWHVSDTGWNRTRTLVTVDTSPKPLKEVKTIWQHLKDRD